MKFELTKQEGLLIFGPELVQNRWLTGVLGDVVVTMEVVLVVLVAHVLEAFLGQPVLLLLEVNLSESLVLATDVRGGNVNAGLVHIELWQLGEVSVSGIELRLNFLLDGFS